MKKLLLMIAAIAAISFTACNTENSEQATDENAVVEDTTAMTPEAFQTQLDSLVTAGDTTAIQNLLTKSQEQVSALVAAGDTLGAKSFWEKVKEIVTGQKEKLVALAPSLGEVVDKAPALPENIKGIVTEGAEGLKDAAVDEAKAELKDAATKAADEVVKDGAKKVEEVKEKVEEGKKAVKDVKEAAKGVKDAANALKNLGK